MEFDERDQLWNAVWKTYYDSYFQEVLSERLVLRWQRFDEFSKVLIALTASGSAISGWALWNEPAFKCAWAGLAGTSAIFAIAHKSMDVARKLNDWGVSRTQFSAIRIGCEKLIIELRVNPQFDVQVFLEKLNSLKNSFADSYGQSKVDAFLTGRLKSSVQTELDVFITSNY